MVIQNDDDDLTSWYRREFAAANAIIDALCVHLKRLDCEKGEYDAVFKTIHTRRLSWKPVLSTQNVFNVNDVTYELDKVLLASAKKGAVGEECLSNESEIAETGSQETQPTAENIITCTNSEECEQRRFQIKTNSLFKVYESMNGKMVNVVDGLKLHENIFTDLELSKLNDFVYDLRVAGQSGKLLGKTFILYNQQTKGNKREMIQFGVPIFERIKDGTDQSQKSYMEPIPAVLQGVIDHLIRLCLILEHKKPSSCIINFFDEGEYSQPFLKPPHLEEPFSTLLLSESKMAYGQSLASYNEGQYKGGLMLLLKKGSLLVMGGNSSYIARHAICSSQNKRVSINFFKVRTETKERDGTTHTNVIPPSVMVHNPMVVSPQRDGTGVFMPGETVSKPQKPAKKLPQLAWRPKSNSLPSSIDGHKSETTSDSRSTTS